mmetsp:Transcript_32750/g.71850  ORF Transcript_32750/g.71850 Transcript_32750/m.71850 type:complete len:720 (-) Transcript_32750:70-2229(-)
MRATALASLIVSAKGFIPPSSLVTRVMSPASSFTSTTSTAAKATATAASALIDAPFGAWESPITSKAITAGSVGIGGLNIDAAGSLLWLEGRPQEGGRYVLCRYDPASPDKSERNAVDVTPKETNVRTRVHEYGGGAVTLGGDDGTIFYSEFSTQRLMRLVEGSGDEPVAITPDCESCRYRFADGYYDKKAQRLIMVREDHTNPNPKDVVNEIVSVNANGSGEDSDINVLATGNDFYSCPRLSPDGKKLAYVTWNHPNMPWDETQLRVVTLDDEAKAESSSHELVAGSDGDTSIIQPKWHPTTGDLFYISDETGYYNIYKGGSKTSVLPMEYDFGGASPGWSLGQQGYSFLQDGRLFATYKKDGASRLLLADVSGDGPARSIEEYGSDDGLPMMFGGVVASVNSEFYFVGGSPSTPTSVFKWSLESKGEAEQLACSSTLKFSEDIVSVPRQIEFPTTLGTAFGYYYPPCNDKYKCTTDDAPPLLVKAHGGPTSCTGTSFNAGIQFWTSRGFAVLDVDYGGSTGYGREYRRRLRGAWGVVDVDDVCAGAKYLVEQGLADSKRLCIDGGSAGGFTTLGALAFRDIFTAGCSLYGIGDLTLLASDTHKFESRYLDGLVGEYPKEEALYKKRSPIESIDTLSCPILLLQGVEDKVVPPNQAESMHQALKKKGLPTCLKLYEGEQHGFRQAANIENALDSELAFYGKIYGIPVPNAIDIEIDNM